jgi:phage-related protein
MALPTLPPYCPDVPLQHQAEWRVWSQSLGDGYETRQLQGINALKRQWTVTWSGRAADQIEEIENFLISVGSGAFTFHDPIHDMDVSVFCDGWTSETSGRMRGGGLYGSLQATFRRAYGYK